MRVYSSLISASIRMDRQYTDRTFAGSTGDERSLSPNRRGRKQLLDARRHDRDRYSVRFMCCLAGSLSLALLAANLPLTQGWDSVGWYVLSSAERLTMEVVEVANRPPVATGTPNTAFQGGEDSDRHGPAGHGMEARRESIQKQIETSDPRAMTRAKPMRGLGRRVFDTAQRMPQIVGGIGSYYIHIEYPEEAMDAGIEGRLVLSFVVEIDGHTTGVEVLQALHPACDSAAVRALRATRFVPGRQNGDTVPVRMRLPVRFELVEPDSSVSSSVSASS